MLTYHHSIYMPQLLRLGPTATTPATVAGTPPSKRNMSACVRLPCRSLPASARPSAEDHWESAPRVLDGALAAMTQRVRLLYLSSP